MTRVKLAILFLIPLSMGCYKVSLQPQERDFSTHGDDESHNYGDNCMNCHYNGYNAEGSYTLAGSIEGSTSVSFIELYRDPSNLSTLVDRVEVDGKGNFYTTEPIDYSDGLYAAIRNNSGARNFMSTKIYNGQCNLCHGKDEESLTTSF